MHHFAHTHISDGQKPHHWNKEPNAFICIFPSTKVKLKKQSKTFAWQSLICRHCLESCPNCMMFWNVIVILSRTTCKFVSWNGCLHRPLRRSKDELWWSILEIICGLIWLFRSKQFFKVTHVRVEKEWEKIEKKLFDYFFVSPFSLSLSLVGHSLSVPPRLNYAHRSACSERICNGS